MLIKTFAHGDGDGEAARDYLLKIEGRENCPPVVLNNGDHQRTVDLINSIDRKWRYTSGVISFERDDAPTEEQQQEVIAAFEKLAFAGLDPDQFDILWVRHQHTAGDRVEMHFLVPRVELSTGLAMNIMPPGWERSFNPIRDFFNEKYAWADPTDPARSRDLRPPRFESSNRIADRETLHDVIMAAVQRGAVIDRASMITLIEELGLEVRDGKHLTVIDPETGMRFRMKGQIYERDWKAEPSRAALEEERAARAEAPRREEGALRAGAREPESRSERLRELSQEIDRIIQSRARFNVSKYQRPTSADVELVARLADAGTPRDQQGDHATSAETIERFEQPAFQPAARYDGDDREARGAGREIQDDSREGCDLLVDHPCVDSVCALGLSPDGPRPYRLPSPFGEAMGRGRVYSVRGAEVHSYAPRGHFENRRVYGPQQGLYAARPSSYSQLKRKHSKVDNNAHIIALRKRVAALRDRRSEESRRRFADLARRIRERIREFAERVRERIREFKDLIRERLDELQDGVEREIDEACDVAERMLGEGGSSEPENAGAAIEFDQLVADYQEQSDADLGASSDATRDVDDFDAAAGKLVETIEREKSYNSSYGFGM